MPQDDKRPEDVTPIEEQRADAIAEAELAAEIEAERPIAPEPPVRRQRRGAGVFLAAVLGGILAAAAGFGLARVTPGGWPVQDTSALETRLAAQSEQIATLESELARLAARPIPDPSADLDALRSEVDQRLSALPTPDAALAETTQALQSTLSQIDARLTEVEKRPVGGGEGVSATALAAYERELQELRDQIGQGGQGTDVTAQIESVAAEAREQLAAAAAEAERLKAEAADTARDVTVTAALGRIRSAAEGGGSFVAAVTDLVEADVAVPEVLAINAETGIPTMAELQRSYPAAAREALSAALRSQTGTGWTDRFTGFLRTQTGIRSLEPRAGDDPDAILSRAEAALANGDLPAVLTELDALPPEAKAQMDDWISRAQTREAANAALTTLSAQAE